MISALPTPPTRSDPATFAARGDTFLAALPTFVSEANALATAMNLNATSSVSTTSLTVGTGTKSLTVEASKSFLPGMSVQIAYTTTPSTWMHGEVISYNAGTGALVVDVTGIQGSGTQAAWTITLSAPITIPVAENIKNLSISATVAAKALTVALKGENGSDPSALNPVSIKFRSATLTDGKPITRTVTAALSVVLPSGGSLGFTLAVPERMYVWAIDYAGTVELALSRTADVFSESNLVSTTAIGAGSDLTTVMYSTSARTNLACRCIGYVEIATGSTGGEWDNAPTKIQVMLPGVRRTGDIVQIAINTTQASASGSTVLPNDGTAPTNTEGDLYLSQSITPVSAINKLVIESSLWLSNDSSNAIGAALFRDSGAVLSVAGPIDGQSAKIRELAITHVLLAGSTSATTFNVRGGGGGGTTKLNSQDASTGYGGKTTSFIKITEVFA